MGHVHPVSNSLSITCLPGATGALSTWPSSCMNALHLDTCEVWLIPTVDTQGDMVTCDAKLPTCAMEIPGIWLFVSHNRSKFTGHKGYYFYLEVYYVHLSIGPGWLRQNCHKKKQQQQQQQQFHVSHSSSAHPLGRSPVLRGTCEMNRSLHIFARWGDCRGEIV